MDRQQDSLTARRAGVLLHPTCLPGEGGIGSLGASARAFVDFLSASGLGWWQVLPLNPTGYGDSPYAAQSSFAGEPLLIDLAELAALGWVEPSELTYLEQVGQSDAIDFAAVRSAKLPLLEAAARRFLERAGGAERAGLDEFRARHVVWLEDFAAFSALKAHFDRRAVQQGVANSCWSRYWPASLAMRDAADLAACRRRFASEIDVCCVLQYWFALQWRRLRQYAATAGVSIIGDLPIYVAEDSADVWSRPELFQLDQRRRPTCVAGVPPDYYSDTGQLWGNPLYRWPAHRAEGFAWWTSRFAQAFECFDRVRIDHFRGFAACWEVPAAAETAEAGRWMASPGRALLQTVADRLGRLPLIAENLGVITADVEVLRHDFELPGMVLLQGAFDEKEDRRTAFLPHNHERNSVVYTGTHDNDTTRGWYEKRSAGERQALAAYRGAPLEQPTWDLIRMVWASVAETAIVPLTDLLDLGSEARFNTPARAEGNWRWRAPANYAERGLVPRLRRLNEIFGR
ncbi:MAG: 4-alpha-glucanotransferase [Deltaproteobacteria bacterium]|nr:4-alpha-glucanotransferase [Deltaproteobacteria bacterium]